jgi:hypothetical protein
MDSGSVSVSGLGYLGTGFRARQFFRLGDALRWRGLPVLPPQKWGRMGVW